MTSSALKIIALILMAAEHSSSLLISESNGIPSLYYLFHYSGRIVFPLFAFLMVEGFFHTSSRKKYLGRLLLLAAITGLGGNLLILVISALTGIPLEELYRSSEGLFRLAGPTGNNIFLSLAAGLLFIMILDRVRIIEGAKKWLTALLLLPVAFISLITEASYHVVPLFLIFYLFHKKKSLMAVSYTLFSLFFLVTGLMNIESFWTFEYQWMMIAALPFILYYNGERGSFNSKLFFYGFYPVHLWVLYVFEIFLKR